jgi:hypothetical protein
MTTVYYLRWDEPDSQVNNRATELFHEYHFDPVTEYTKTEFENLYREVGETDTEDLEQLWREWNRGSGYEAEEFLEQETRSMSVGDVAELEDEYYVVAPIGWEDIGINR